jgi:rubrerythrin
MIVPSTGESITYRPYVVKEEKILLIALESQDDVQIEKAVINIIKACVESPINVNDLATFDIEFIFITLRSKSVGEGVKLSMKCMSETCDVSEDINLELDKIKVSNLENIKDKNIKITDDISIDMRWLKASDKLTEAQRKTTTDSIIASAAKAIEIIYNGEEIFATKDAQFKEVINFVESLNTDQFTSILEHMEQTPILSYDLSYNCKTCGNENIRELRGLTDFFI